MRRSVYLSESCLAIVHFPLKLISSRMLAPSVRHLVFTRDDGKPLDFIPGQFVQVHFHNKDGIAAKRSYSLATIHDHALGPGEAVEIAVSYVSGGAATALLPTNGIVFLPFADEPEPVAFSAVWSPSNRSAALRNLLSLANDMGRKVCTDYRSILPRTAKA